MSGLRATEMDWKEPEGWPSDAGRDRLIGDWYLYQRKGGHKTSTDDLITAWYATHRTLARGKEPIAQYMDLGSGIGSVLLMVCHKLSPAVATGIEAQPQSAAMATRSIAELPDHSSQIRVLLSDFREANAPENNYELITGSPPYFPLDAGVLPKDSQRRACRFEARGGVEAYAQAASRFLSATGRFYLVHQTRAQERVVAAAEAAHLHLHGRAEFFMRSDRSEPFLTVFEFGKEPCASVHSFACPVRDHEGEISPGYQRIRLQLGVS